MTCMWEPRPPPPSPHNNTIVATAILDDRKSPSIAFLVISDQYATFILFEFFYKMAAGGHFGWPKKITFDRISRHFISILNFKKKLFAIFFWNFVTKWPPVATFDRISRHFISIRNFFICNFLIHKMAAGGHFGWPKTLSIAFLAISDQYATFIFWEMLSQNVRWRPLWTENQFWSLFSPFQINTQLFIFLNFFLQNGRRQPFWMTENHFRSHFSPFQINTLLLFFWKFYHKISAGGKSLSIAFLTISDQYTTFHFSDFFSTKWPLAPILDDRKSLSIALLAISDQCATFIFLEILSHNVLRWPFWMTENNFRSHFSPFQINTQLLFFWEISSQNVRRRPFWMTENHFPLHFSPFHINMLLYFFWKFCHKMSAGGHFGPKMTFDCISRHFRSICNLNFSYFFFHKMAVAAILDDRKSLLIAFLAISDKYATFIFLEILSQNVRRRPFWTENDFRLHFSPFQINMQLEFFLNFFHKMAVAAILDDRKLLLIAFLAISDQYATFIFLKKIHKMAAGGHFGWPKITFARISCHFKMAASGHFGCPIFAKIDRDLSL